MDLNSRKQHVGSYKSRHKPDLVDCPFEEEAGKFNQPALGEIAPPIPPPSREPSAWINRSCTCALRGQGRVRRIRGLCRSLGA